MEKGQWVWPVMELFWKEVRERDSKPEISDRMGGN